MDWQTKFLLAFSIIASTVWVYEIIVELLTQCLGKKIGGYVFGFTVKVDVFLLGMCLAQIALILAG